MTASLQVSKKDNKYYIHLQWRQNGKRVQKCIGTGLSAKDNNKRKAEKSGRQKLPSTMKTSHSANTCAGGWKRSDIRWKKAPTRITKA